MLCNTITMETIEDTNSTAKDGTHVNELSVVSTMMIGGSFEGTSMTEGDGSVE